MKNDTLIFGGWAATLLSLFLNLLSTLGGHKDGMVDLGGKWPTLNLLLLTAGFQAENIDRFRRFRELEADELVATDG